MGQFLLLVVVALTVGAIVFGVTVLLTGGDRGLSPAEPDGRAVPLPGSRPLVESDIAQVRFDTALRGYRMAQVDQALRRAAYDVGYKDELINVLEAEVEALRAGRTSDAEVLRRAREAAQAGTASGLAATATLPAPAPATPTTDEVAVLATEVPVTVGEQDGWRPADQVIRDPVAPAPVVPEPTATADDGDGTGSTNTSGDSGDTDPDSPAADPINPDGIPEQGPPASGDDQADEEAASDEEADDEQADDETPSATASGGLAPEGHGDSGADDGSDAPETDTALPSRR